MDKTFKEYYSEEISIDEMSFSPKDYEEKNAIEPKIKKLAESIEDRIDIQFQEDNKNRGTSVLVPFDKKLLKISSSDLEKVRKLVIDKYKLAGWEKVNIDLKTNIDDNTITIRYELYNSRFKK